MGWDWLKNIGGALSGLFGGGGGSTPGLNSAGIKGIGFPGGGSQIPGAAMSSMGGGGGGWGNALKGLGGGVADMFGGKQGMAGLGMMGIGSMIPNAKAPGMPDEFKNYMGMLNQGGTPGMQSANQYYQGVLSGNNQGAYDAATWSLDKSYEEEVRKMNAMYKTLRPGTDPSSDSTYQRDLNLLNQNYAQNRANVMAGVQQGAASGAAGLGTNLANMQGGAVQQYVDQIATQWGMNQAQRQALRDMITGVGGKMITGPIDMQSMLTQIAAMKKAGA